MGRMNFFNWIKISWMGPKQASIHMIESQGWSNRFWARVIWLTDELPPKNTHRKCRWNFFLLIFYGPSGKMIDSCCNKHIHSVFCAFLLKGISIGQIFEHTSIFNVTCLSNAGGNKTSFKDCWKEIIFIMAKGVLVII